MSEPVTTLELLKELARLLKLPRTLRDSIVDPNYRRDDIYARLTEIVVEHAKLSAERESLQKVFNWLGNGGYDRELHMVPMPVPFDPCQIKLLDADLLESERTKRVTGSDWTDVLNKAAQVITDNVKRT